MHSDDYTIARDQPILITGSNGFIGRRVIAKLVEYGFRDLRCLVRSESRQPSVDATSVSRIVSVKGDLLSADACREAAHGVRLVYHLAAPTELKSVPEACENAISTMSNLLNALAENADVERFVLVSSFSVYSNVALKPGSLLDESCAVESEPELRGEAYSCAKIKQEETLRSLGHQLQIPYVIVRPGVVYGPGKNDMPGRVGISKRNVLVHLGGSNVIPFTYVDNCAEAIVLAGLKRGIDGEAVNVVDDGQLTSREFVGLYKKGVGNLRTLSVARPLSRLLFRTAGFLSRFFGSRSLAKYNERRWSAYWGGNTYSNAKAKALLGWTPRVSIEEGMTRFFEYCRRGRKTDA